MHTDTSSLAHNSPARRALVALGGPAVAGAVLCLPFGPARVLVGAAALPAILVGVTLLMVPALYIASAILGVAPSPSAVIAAVARGLGACGILLLGLAPPAAFLLATARGDLGTRLLTLGVVGAAVIAGVRVLGEDLFGAAPRRGRALAMLGAWSAVAIAIGSHLLFDIFHA